LPSIICLVFFRLIITGDYNHSPSNLQLFSLQG
jgi:hypothetical protein